MASRSNRLYKSVGSVKILRRLAHPLVSNTVKTAANHYGFNPDEVAAAALGASIFLSLASFFLVTPLNVLAAFPCALTVGYFSLTYVLNALPEKLEVERNTMAKYAGLILQEIYFIVKTGGSIFDALNIISRANYPMVSEKFREILLRIQNGESPEQMILNFAYTQPSDAFRRGLVEFISSYELTEGQAKKMIELAEDEARGYLKEYSYQLESRLLIFFGLSFFFPIVVAFALALYGLAASPSVLFVIPLDLVLTDTLSHRLMSERIDVLG
jgi:pilus assembly protein TadC